MNVSNGRRRKKCRKGTDAVPLTRTSRKFSQEHFHSERPGERGTESEDKMLRGCKSEREGLLRVTPAGRAHDDTVERDAAFAK